MRGHRASPHARHRRGPGQTPRRRPHRPVLHPADSRGAAAGGTGGRLQHAIDIQHARRQPQEEPEKRQPGAASRGSRRASSRRRSPSRWPARTTSRRCSVGPASAACSANRPCHESTRSILPRAARRATDPLRSLHVPRRSHTGAGRDRRGARPPGVAAGPGRRAGPLRHGPRRTIKAPVESLDAGRPAGHRGRPRARSAAGHPGHDADAHRRRHRQPGGGAGARSPTSAPPSSASCPTSRRSDRWRSSRPPTARRSSRTTPPTWRS